MEARLKKSGPGADGPAIELEGATLVREGAEVLSELSLRIGAKERVALLGPNGSGKSSLVGLISGDFHAVHREPAPVRLFGQELWNLFALRERIGIVSDRYQARHSRGDSVEEVLLSAFFGSIGLPLRAEISSEMRSRARETADFLGISSLMERPSSSLSSGEMRRLLVGRALVHEPEMLFLDEPYTSLDIAAKHSFSSLVRALAARGHGLVIVTHDISEIPPEVDRVVLLQAGRVFAEGPKEAMLDEVLLSELYGLDLRVLRDEGLFRAEARA